MEAAKNNNSSSSSAKTGLLLIKIGFALVFVIPMILVSTLGGLVGQFGFFSMMPMLFLPIIIAFITIGGTLSIFALKFGKDAVRLGQKEKADYAIILGVAVFLVGSNIAGILIAIGGYLIRKSI